jgi:hypothetical protein
MTEHQPVNADYDALVSGLVDLMENHWINLANSTDRHLAENYGLVVTVDDLRDLLAETCVFPPAEGRDS